MKYLFVVSLLLTLIIGCKTTTSQLSVQTSSEYDDIFPGKCAVRSPIEFKEKHFTLAFICPGNPRIYKNWMDKFTLAYRPNDESDVLMGYVFTRFKREQSNANKLTREAAQYLGGDYAVKIEDHPLQDERIYLYFVYADEKQLIGKRKDPTPPELQRMLLLTF